ncbi:MAG TPA: efflux RND transporter periplasmic adaptor subunit [Candidatus Polarisedimenticolaceae bacterium]
MSESGRADEEFQRKLNALKIDRDERGRSGLPVAWMVVGGVLVIVAAAAAWWLFRPRPLPVRTALVEEEVQRAQGGPTVLNASGYVTARRQSTVASKVTGKVVEVLVEEGMKVEKDQVLARLDPSQANQSLALARAQLETARRATGETEAQLREATLRLRRVKDLLAGGMAAPSDGDAVEAEVGVLEARRATQEEQVREAERTVDIARQAVADTVIRAPFAGVAISKNAQPGEIISPMSAGGGFTRTGISTIVDMSSLEIEVDVNEAYIQRVVPGQRVEATLDAYRDWTIPAHVITTIPAADRQKATVTVRIAFDRLDPRILPDMGIKVAFLGDAGASTGRVTPVVRVPRAAVRGSIGEEFVFVVKGDGTLERRAVKLGPGSEDPAEVMAGLSAGERVVTAGPADLKEGLAVAEQPESN